MATFVVLNKADYLDPAALAEAQEFTADVVAKVTGRPQREYPMSARAALGASGDPGFCAFAADFLAYLDEGRLSGLAASVTRHACRLARQMLDEVTLAQRAVRLPGDEADARAAAFGECLRAVSARQADAEGLAKAESGRLLDALNAAAERACSQLPADVSAQLPALLDGDLMTAPAAEIERQGSAQLTRLVTEAAENWRQDQAQRLESGLCAIDERLSAELESELAAIRHAAADLLGIDLALPSPGQRMPGNIRFFYAAHEHIDQAELLAGSVRRRLPGRPG